MVLFHNAECGNKGNKLKSWLLFLSWSLFPLDCTGLAYLCPLSRDERLKPADSKGELINSLSGSYCINHVMNEWLRKPEDSKQVN